MNSVIFKLICESIIFIAAIITAIVSNKKDKKVLTIFAIIAAIAAFASSFIFNDVPKPNINREPDYSAVVLSADDGFDIEYRISTNGDSSNEWIKYDKPFKLERSAIIYARAKTLWYKSEEEYRAAYLSENGLVYFGSAEEPSDTILSISASYNIKDPIVNKQAGNHYEGYEIKKEDIKVTGITINGEEKEIKNFSYSPRILKLGKNTIKVEYSIADEMSISSNLYVNGDSPALIKLSSKYIGGNVYLDTKLDSTNFSVKGTYEDGTQKDISGFSVSPTEVKEGKNIITITKDGLSDTVEINAIDRETITENEVEPNDEISSANDIDVNVKYSGNLKDEDDVDYYRLYIKQKGNIYIKLSHPKIDDGGTFWNVSFLSQDEEPIVELNSTGKNVDTTSSKARVSAGVYYIKVSNYYYSKEKYTISTLFEEEDDLYESEPNDDLNNEAMIIELDKKYTGNLTTEDDIDYYKFTLNEKRKVWIDYSHQKTSTRDTLWSLSLLGDSEGSILSLNSTGENANITSDGVRLPAGNYYLKIKDYYWSDMDYSFCINSKKEGDDFETEENNDYGTATKISINSSITGNLQSEDDVDFYRFDLKNSVSINISFSHEQFDSRDTYWCYQLYSAKSSEALKNDGDDTTVYIKGDSSNTISNNWSSLKSGTYFIKVYKYYYCNNDYTISLSD